MQLIPAIDLRAGRCVRLLQGDFERETHYETPPREVARAYRAQGARWLHVVDLDGAREGQLANRSVVKSLASGGVRLQVGGGLRSAQAIAEVLTQGAARVVVGSAAVLSPADACIWLDDLGGEQVVLAFDVRIDAAGVPRVAIHGWREQTELSLWSAVESYRGHVRHVLCTDVDRDGALAGPNIALYREAVRRFPEVAWQASGGVRDVSDLKALEAVGVAATISGRALLEGRLAHGELEPFWQSA